ncbi:MAG: hypothetical protein JSS87_14385 [Acidobacteria bacterium]|nr:hypothetical protein [Acidobacteriota bacterium]
MDTTNSNYTPETTVGELRQRYGRHFAEGHEDQETLGKVLGLAGANSLEEYLQRLPKTA